MNFSQIHLLKMLKYGLGVVKITPVKLKCMLPRLNGIATAIPVSYSFT